MPSTTLESDIESAVCRYAERLGCWQRKFSSPGRRSAPDRIFAYQGRVWWIEFKAPGKKPTDLQRKEHEKMRAAWLTVHVCDDKDEGKGIIDAEIASAAC